MNQAESLIYPSIDRFIYSKSWVIWLILIVLFIFLLWLFYGGGDHKYIGLDPLNIGIDSRRYISEKNYAQIEQHESKLDKYQMKSDEYVSESISESSDTSELSFIESLEQYFESGENDEIDITPKIPSDLNHLKNLALGDHTCYNNSRLSKGEKLCKQAIEKIYNLPFYCVRPNFLKNPETGRNLELDLYNDSLKIAIEYSGKQHYHFPNTYHKTYQDFINQVKRDQFKVNACDANGVYLITVPYNVPLNLESIKKYIEYYLPHNVKKRLNLSSV